jgi:hypothetical protein
MWLQYFEGGIWKDRQQILWEGDKLKSTNLKYRRLGVAADKKAF